MIVSLFAAAAVFLGAGWRRRVGPSGARRRRQRIGVLFLAGGLHRVQELGRLLAVPLGFAVLGALTGMIGGNDRVAETQPIRASSTGRT